MSRIRRKWIYCTLVKFNLKLVLLLTRVGYEEPASNQLRVSKKLRFYKTHMSQFCIGSNLLHISYFSRFKYDEHFRVHKSEQFGYKSGELTWNLLLRSMVLCWLDLVVVWFKRNRTYKSQHIFVSVIFILFLYWNLKPRFDKNWFWMLNPVIE